MKPLPCYRAAHLLPYLAFLNKIGAPVERGLRRVKLPTMLADRPDAYLPELPTLAFLTQMSSSEGIDELGLRAVPRLGMTDLSERFVTAAWQSPTLQAALEHFHEFAYLEDPYLHFRVTYGRTTVKLCCLSRFPSNSQGLRYDDWGDLLALVAIVRAFAGPRWYPEKMAFRSSFPLSRYASEQFPNTLFLVGQQTAWISVHRDLLSLPLCAEADVGRSQPGAGAALPSAVEPKPDLKGSLKAVLSAYLPEGLPPIELAAEMAVTSVRTLQRRLNASGLTYSDLIGEVRYTAAARLLEETDATVLDIALELGYEDPSHFARAFRRMAGVSPREFRRQRLAHYGNCVFG